MISRMTVLLITAAALSHADTGVEFIEWENYQVVSGPEHDNVIAAARAPDLSAFRVVTFGVGVSDFSWSLLTLDRYGREESRVDLLSCSGQLEYWAAPCFFGDDSLALVYGDRLGSGPAFLLLMDCGDHALPEPVPLQVPMEQGLFITSLVKREGEGFMAAGCHDFPFTVMIHEDGTAEAPVEITSAGAFQPENARMEILENGDFIISLEEDGFPGGVHAARLDNRGDLAWSAWIKTESEFTALISDFAELPDGNIFCAGTFDQLGTFQLRGLLSYLTPDMQEIWTETFRISDHTGFNSILVTRDGDIVVAGWTGASGMLPYQAVDTDIVICRIDGASGELAAFRIVEEGDQSSPVFFEGGFDEFFLMGRHIPEDREVSDVFWGRAVLD